MKVALIQGGMSAEREVSLSTGAAFEKALQQLKLPYDVLDAQENLPERLMKIKPDVALLALHGRYAEDGTVQGICEYLKIPYTGSGVLGSALCMDKILSKQIIVSQGLPTPDFEVCDTNIVKIENFKPRLIPPFVVKPSREGSSVGVSIVRDMDEFAGALSLAASLDSQVLIEEYIDGKEIAVSVFSGKALTPIEIEPKEGFYDYKNKYTAGRTEYYLPARISEELLAEVQSTALAAFQALRMRSYGRVDFRMSPRNKFYFIEANTLPGCTPTSLVPKAARHMGIEFEELIQTLIEDATLDYAPSKDLV